MDFLLVSSRSVKKGVIEIYPKFIVNGKSNDLMIRGGDFYAVWDAERGLWSTDEDDAIRMIDRELDKFAEDNREKFSNADIVRVLHVWDAETGMIDRWHKFCQKQMRDCWHQLDEKLIFSNTDIKKRDYASRKLEYPLVDGPCDAWNELMSVLYSEEERRKIEWAIGSVVNGDSKKLQKFLVLYGAAGTGKSTVLNVIQKLFDGYYATFDAKALGSANNVFALEAFKSNPLVAIQHDGDLSHIEDNTRLNSLVSHEMLTVNAKFERLYSQRFKSFLFMGTNKPVRITDAKSGLIRRLIDVSPTGNKIGYSEYKKLIKQIDFELGAIAWHCKSVYEEDPEYYDDYIPVNMLSASNDFYDFVVDSYFIFKEDNEVTLTRAWDMYKAYCEQARVLYPLSRRVFKEELKNYFDDFKERCELADGTRARNVYSVFRFDKFEQKPRKGPGRKSLKTWLIFEEHNGFSIFDEEFAECPAQLASSVEKPTTTWAKCKTKLKDIDTHKLHYVKTPEQIVHIDFDIPGEDGKKSLEKNIEAASSWPRTYAELSKSGAGIHLTYFYDGDVGELSNIVAEHIEVKIGKGNSSLRRKLTKCNNWPIATISSGLPKKEKKGDKMVDFEAVKSEKALRDLIIRNLNKEIHPNTKPSCDFIKKILDDAYESDLEYDVSDMRNALIAFATRSHNQANTCLKIMGELKLKSKNISENNINITDIPDDISKNNDAPIAFFDIEVFPNLFLVNYKIAGEGKSMVRLINPRPADLEKMMKYRLIGFNNRKYDNHLVYAKYIYDYSTEQLYKLSQRIITGDKKDCFFGEAYNLSYTDVYDFAAKKQGLKKWEIELGIHHQELGLPWDQPVPEEMWPKVSAYCDNDVLATEAVFDHLKADFIAREVLADVAGMTVNDTTNSLTTRIIFGVNRHPQDQFNYRDMGAVDDKEIDTPTKKMLDLGVDLDYTVFQHGMPVFPGYEFKNGKSTYRGEEVGEGGYVYAEPGIHVNNALDDVASMHPSSIVAENLFGDEYTKRFKEILEARIAIKHKDFAKAKKMLNGALAKYLDDESRAKDLAQALKIAINSVYGLTSAKFDNPFRDRRNVDNIVAKRGALFMINLKHEVQRRGFTVAHIKTDSIKIPNANRAILQFVYDYGQLYGYTFEHEATYDRMCLVNDAVYIAKYASPDKCDALYGYVPGDNEKHGNEWTATGTQFAVPYVFKTLFSKEPIEFKDLCETKSVTASMYLDMNEDLPDVSEYEKELSKLESKYKKGELSDTLFEPEGRRLYEEIEKGHNYIFIGKVGSFCPIKPGAGGGKLYRYDHDKYYAVAGTKDYRWLESEIVTNLKKEADIDHSYYISLVDDAKDTIGKYGDFEMFVAEEPYVKAEPVDDFMNVPESEDNELPFN